MVAIFTSKDKYDILEVGIIIYWCRDNNLTFHPTKCSQKGVIKNITQFSPKIKGIVVLGANGLNRILSIKI